jgi:hypothetical protein
MAVSGDGSLGGVGLVPRSFMNSPESLQGFQAPTVQLGVVAQGLSSRNFRPQTLDVALAVLNRVSVWSHAFASIQGLNASTSVGFMT